MKINNIFKSIQGEGRYAGFPVVFIRTSGCTRKCPWCDTQYHEGGKEYSTGKIIDSIEINNCNSTIVWTGGEPLLQFEGIKDVILRTSFSKIHHLETNGDLLSKYNLETLGLYFNYICISPKSLEVIKLLPERSRWMERVDIKVVTDLEKVNMDLINYATMLMPLTSVNDEKKDLEVKKKVWNYCKDNNIVYSPRLHIDIWGKNKRGV